MYSLIVFDWNGTLSTGRVPAGSDSEIAPLFPSVPEVLKQLDESGVLLGIATAASRREIIQALTHHGILSRFMVIQTADDGPIKPHPDALLRAMELTGVGPVDTLAVGDTARDMQMARNAGVTALGVTYGILDKNQLIQAGAHATLDNIQHLPLWLKGEKT